MKKNQENTKRIHEITQKINIESNESNGLKSGQQPQATAK